MRYDAAVRFAVAAVLTLLAAATALAAGAEIGDISVSPSAPVPGTAITITFEIRNPDKRPLPTGVVDVRVRGKSIGVITTPAMAAGDRRRVSGGVTLPKLDDKSVRLELVPHNGTPGAVLLTLAPRPATGESPPAAVAPARSREIAAPNFVGTRPVRSREAAAPNFVGTPTVRSREAAGPNFVGAPIVRSREIAAPNFIGIQPVRSRDIAAPSFVGTRPPQ